VVTILKDIKSIKCAEKLIYMTGRMECRAEKGRAEKDRERQGWIRKISLNDRTLEAAPNRWKTFD